MGIHPLGVVRVAAGFDERPNHVGRFRLAEQDTVNAPSQNLAELPGVEVDVLLVGPIHRGFDDDGWRPVAGVRRTAIAEAAHVLGQAGQVERAVLESDVDVVGPGVGVGHPLLVGQDVAGVAANVVDRLVRGE